MHSQSLKDNMAERVSSSAEILAQLIFERTLMENIPGISLEIIIQNIEYTLFEMKGGLGGIVVQSILATYANSSEAAKTAGVSASTDAEFVRRLNGQEIRMTPNELLIKIISEIEAFLTLEDAKKEEVILSLS